MLSGTQLQEAGCSLRSAGWDWSEDVLTVVGLAPSWGRRGETDQCCWESQGQVNIAVAGDNSYISCVKGY